METKTDLKYKHKILVIDDEPGILKAVKRILRKIPCSVEITDSPEKGLEILKNEKPPFSLIISDQRMPEMKGAVFLEKAKAISPHAIRFLITGYTDMDALVDAINKGGIHRFIAKPWEDADFIKIITEGLKQYELILENKRLLAIVAKQNKELGTINKKLEEKVRERTIEISNKNARLVKSNKDLTESLFNTIRSIDSLIHTINPELSEHGRRVSSLSIQLGMAMNFSESQLRNLEIASLLHDIGRIKLPAFYDTASNDLASSKKNEYLDHPAKGQEILKFIPQLEYCSKIIRHHHENYDGSGFPDKLDEKNIPVESRIIQIADTYDKLHINKTKLDSAIKNFIAIKKISPDEMDRKTLIENAVMNTLQQNTFSVFDPDILKKMLELIKNQKLNYSIEIELKPSELKPGDILSQNVSTVSGNIIFEKGTVINQKKIEKINSVLKTEVLKGPLKIIEHFGKPQE
ncbi:MAG: response regulator [Desulfobacteraceae bacterium]|nr:response regulator [Desulfobacteraceae bacterium]